MKKVCLIVSVICLVLGIGIAWSEHPDSMPKENDSNKEAAEEVNTKQQCPITRMTENCLYCHATPSFKLKEQKPEDLYDTPVGMELIFHNNIPVAAYFKLKEIDCDGIDNMFKYMDNRKDLPRKVIIDVHSYGGSLLSGWKIVSKIQSKWDEYDIETRLEGMALSAGFMIFNAGENRVCGPHAEGMWHETRSYVMFDEKKLSKLKDNVEIYEHLQENANEWIASRSSVTVEEIHQKITVDNRAGWWISGKELFEHGFCDVLIGGK